MGRLVDITGQRFGRLTVIKRTEDYISPKGYKASRWLCHCDCGNDVIVRKSDLTSKRTLSCGCYNKEVRYNLKKKYNTYDLSGGYGIGYTSKGEEFYFDLEDYDLIKDYCWHIRDDGYVASAKTMFHRIVMGSPDVCYDIDHKHGETTRNDNRKYNLRITTTSQNMMNVGLRSHNKSGVTGVIWHKRRRKWRAFITVNQKFIELGCFDNFEDAVKVRKEAEDKYFGEFSYDNSQGYNNIKNERN